MHKLYYLCANCRVPDQSDENGNCAVCGADRWIEKDDFEDRRDWINEVCHDAMDKMFVRSCFEWDLIKDGPGHMVYQHPGTHSQHSYPINQRRVPNRFEPEEDLDPRGFPEDD